MEGSRQGGRVAPRSALNRALSDSGVTSCSQQILGHRLNDKGRAWPTDMAPRELSMGNGPHIERARCWITCRGT